MELEDIDLERLKKDVKFLKIDKNASYIQAYYEWIKFFKKLNSIEKHQFFIVAYLVYGWMPTIPNFHTKELRKILKLLNKAKKTRNPLAGKELEVLKKCINNSMVGTSKLLHFINPRTYAIYDGVVFKYITGIENYNTMNRPEKYLSYLQLIHSISQSDGYREVHSLVEKKCGYEIEPTRAIEMIMYETGRNS